MELLLEIADYFLISLAVFFAPVDAQSITVQFDFMKNTPTVQVVKHGKTYYALAPEKPVPKSSASAQPSAENTDENALQNYTIKPHSERPGIFVIIRDEMTVHNADFTGMEKNRDLLQKKGEIRFTLNDEKFRVKAVERDKDSFIKKMSVMIDAKTYCTVSYSREIHTQIVSDITKKKTERKELIQKRIADEKQYSFGLHLAEEHPVKKYKAVIMPDGRTLYVQKEPSISHKDVENSVLGMTWDGYPSANINMTGEGEKKVAEVTRKNIGRYLVFMVGGKPLFAGIINSEITGGLLITGGFTWPEMEYYSGIINKAVKK